MKDYLVKAIDKTKNLRLITVDAKDLVSEAQKRHDTWSASSAVLGRTLIGGLLLSAALLKDKDDNSEENEGFETLEQCYEEMRKRVQQEFENGLDKPTISVDVDFVELSKTVEYKEYKNLLQEKIKLWILVTLCRFSGSLVI